MHRPRHSLLIALVVLALAIASCGGGKSDGGAATVPGGSGAGPLTGATAPPGTVGGTGPLAAAKTYTGLERKHVGGPIRYRQTPPVGGEHAAIWATCGAYGEPVASPYGVHSMEHGAVWITYRPSLPAGQREMLQQLVVDNPYLLVSPWATDALPSPVVLTAWGVQLGVDSASSPAVGAFVQAYEQGPQTPERGAACAGGMGSPQVQSRVPT